MRAATKIREKEAADLIVAIGTTMEADLRAATEIREKEAADFAAELLAFQTLPKLSAI